MKIAEIETTDKNADHGWRDWLVVHVDMESRYVSIRHDYWSPNSGERKTWQDEGSGCAAQYLDELIAALQTARATLNPEST